MKNKKCKYLIDTSIQIKRLISQKWYISNHDSIWDEIIPITCFYSLMEFKNTVIAALDYLSDVIAQIKEDSNMSDLVKIRLGEVIKELNIDSTYYERDRRVRIANAYAVKMLEDYQHYSKPSAVDEVLLQLKCEALNLEEIGFYYIGRRGKSSRIKSIDKLNCELGKQISIVEHGRNAYTCRKEKFKCKISQFLCEKTNEQELHAITQRKIKIRDQRLKKGAKVIIEAIKKKSLKKNTSIGQRMCFPLGDFLIVSKARKNDLGIFTADIDQFELAKHWNLNAILYKSKQKKIMVQERK